MKTKAHENILDKVFPFLDTPHPPTLNSNLLMIALYSALSRSRLLTWPWAAIHAVTYSRRDCLTAVWSTQARSCGMCTPGGERWSLRCLMNAVSRWDQTSDRMLQHNFSTGGSGLRPQHPIQPHRRGKP